ncbi:response regulator transcription factor [Fontibacillus sp. BL9]|uniref:response regulator transcription factor n=1 Tax=Fontibacillus sp. BL9 TaxID=3389971 RepID=UPI00397B7815
MEKILIIEDEKPFARLMELELQYEGYETQTAHDGRSGLEMALADTYDYILLDLMLPNLNGIEVCKRIRASKSTPIIMLTARDSLIDKVNGLDSGADDYMPKPIEIEELLARLRTIKRRVRAAEATVYEAGDLELNVSAHTATRSGQSIELSAREFELLHMLMKNKNRALSRETLLDQVWGTQFMGQTNVVDVYIRYLRSKMDDGFGTRLIHTLRGVGYVLRDPEEERR